MPSQVESFIRNTIMRTVGTLAEVNRHLMREGPNPFLVGDHQPLSREVTLTDLQVTGEIPRELDGRYVRNGPNPVAPPKAAAHHWFLGDAMLHGVRLKDGKAEWYRNRWIRGHAVSKALGERSAPGHRRNFDVVNTNIVPHAGRAWAVVEAGAAPVRIGPQLETIAHDGFGGTLRGGFSAHPHTDPDTGELHAICYDAMDPDSIRHVVVTKFGDVRREERIRVNHGPMIHDCMITQHYVLILDLPVTLSVKRLLAGYRFPYGWNPEHRPRVGLLPREGSDKDVVWCDVDPCYVFHPCNAFETSDGRVVLDVCVHNKMFDESTQGPDSTRAPFERWTIDPTARRVTRAVIDDTAQEFPRQNETRMGKPYRYAYCLGLTPRHAFVDSATYLIKLDLEDRTRAVHDFGPNSVPGEFVFVPRADARAEDDGWLMGYVLDRAQGTTDLVILDAARFTAPPAARITIAQRIPPGFHGNWLPSASEGG